MHHLYGKSRHYMSLLQVKGPKMNPSLCGIFLCSLLAIFQHSRSMLNQLHQTTCAQIRDQLVLMKSVMLSQEITRWPDIDDATWAEASYL